MMNIVTEIKKYFTVKLFVSIIVVVGILPLFQSLYWIFETAYFGYFGVSPEIFNRPVFSSGFISAWLFASSVYPALLAWTGLMVIIFVVLTVFNYETPVFMKQKVSGQNQSESTDGSDKVCIDSQSRKQKTLPFTTKIVDAIAKSLNIPLILWVGGFLVLLIVISLFYWANSAGRELAQTQVANYLKENFECIDGFNANNIGCFSIDGIEGDDHLVITNSKTHLIYLSRSKSAATDEKVTGKSINIELHIIEKAVNEVFRISRQYKHSPVS